MGHRRRHHGNHSLIRVAPTSLGRGVFAARPIRRHTTIGEIRGTLVRDPTYSSEYCMDLGGGLALEPHPPFRFVNHSCDPNCEIYFFDGPEDDAERLYLQSIEDIEPGVQLTIDYGWSAEGAIPCACHSPLCRGWIVSEDDLPRLLAHLAAERGEIVGACGPSVLICGPTSPQRTQEEDELPLSLALRACQVTSIRSNSSHHD